MSPQELFQLGSGSTRSIPGLPLGWLSGGSELGVGYDAVEIDSTENFLALAEGLGEGVALCRDNRIAWASERLAGIAGRGSPQQLIGVNLGKLPAGKYKAEWRIGRAKFKKFDKNGWAALLETLPPGKASRLSVDFTVVGASKPRK